MSIMFGSKYEQFRDEIGKDKIWEDNVMNLLGRTNKLSLNFNTQMNNLSNKASQKLSTLSRMKVINILSKEE